MNKEREFGPIFNKTAFLKPLLDLQTSIENLSTEPVKQIDGSYKHIKLEDICHKPLSQSSVCNIQSIWAYWQDNAALLDETLRYTKPDGFVEENYLDHFLSCTA